MPWVSVSFLAGANKADSWCDALLEAGALSASIEDANAGTPEETPQFGEPGEKGVVWEHSRIVALFEALAPVRQIMKASASMLRLAEIPVFSQEIVEDKNWVLTTQSQFEPIQISSRLWIVPSWHTPPDPAAINLKLDPGMAFGTGSHPTTRLCLEWLEKTLIPGETLLDYGCGSGILAIAGIRLGAARAVGVDIDPQAIAAARDNALNNQVSVQFEDAATPLTGVFDRVVANILSNPLRTLAASLASHVRVGGQLALSGILEPQADELIRVYAPWVSLSVADTHEGWVCLSGERRCS